MSYAVQASILADTEELATTAGQAVGSSRRAGLDPSAYRGLIAATVTLGGRPLNAHAWDNDQEMGWAVSELQSEVEYRLYQATNLAAEATKTLNIERNKKKPDVNVIDDCVRALNILAPLRARLSYALSRLHPVPDDLEDTYAESYDLVRSGHHLPFNGRWTTGETP